MARALPSDAVAPPPPNPGVDLTPAALAETWQRYTKPQKVTEFKGSAEREAGTELRVFSNFFAEAEFEFEVPAELCAVGFTLSAAERCVRCQFSEKAIMLCKAAVMGDRASWELIKAAADPLTAKGLRRSVEPWDEERWTTVVCAVAFSVVWQKFAKTPALLPVLLATGDSFIVEATRADKVWGIGLDKGDARIAVPGQWKGTNVLGWALMEARDALRRSVPELPKGTARPSNGRRAKPKGRAA